MRGPFLFLDLDNTLLDFSWAERNALQDTLRQAGIEPKQELLSRYSEINIRQWEMLEEGLLTRDQVLLRRFELLFHERGISADPAKIGAEYERRLAFGHRFLPGAEELLDALQGRARLYLASNGSIAVQESRLESAGIRPYFDGVFLSEQLGADKPSRTFFLRCFEQIPGFSPERAMMVGDSLSSDIRGGYNAGIKTCWFNPKGKPCLAEIKPDYEIHQLSELPPLLDQIFG